ncbi:MAG: ParB/RepB/Spo0J family partition protein, partial [Ruminococcaceae bacterium]|nr:ParB/RepB/Spo0J family partition protein [Oscillospiraceae bacterium]
MKKSGLGRGLDSLFDQNNTDSDSILEIRLSEIEPNKNQPRRDFDEQAIAELADSIREHGLLQPILVRPLENGMYQIIAGERRWRACRLAELSTVPVIIKNMDDRKTMEVSIIENLQREDLNPVEEALGFKSLIDTYGITQEEAAARVGKSRSAIA